MQKAKVIIRAPRIAAALERIAAALEATADPKPAPDASLPELKALVLELVQVPDDDAKKLMTAIFKTLLSEPDKNSTQYYLRQAFGFLKQRHHFAEPKNAGIWSDQITRVIRYGRAQTPVWEWVNK